MKSLGSYTLGDQYVSPNRRLSAMLTQQGSKGGPSNSWQETMGRIAQQLAGAYIGRQDSNKQNQAFDAQTGLEPDSTSIQPNFKPDEIANYKAETNTRPPQVRESDLAQSMINENEIPTLSRQMSQPQISEESFGPGQQGPGQPKIDGSGWDNLPDLSEVHRVNTIAGVPTPDPRDQMAKLMQESQSGQLNEKMNPRDYSMQQLRGLENNPYAKRILAQMMMQNADRDYAAEQLKGARGFKTSERLAGQEYGDVQLDKKLGAAEKIANLKSSLPVTGIREYQQALQNKLIPEGTSFMDYVQNKSIKMLNPLQKSQLAKNEREKTSDAREIKSNQIKDQDALIALKRKTGMLDDTIKRAKDNINWWSTGAPGTISSIMPNETDRSNLDSDLLTLKANLGFDSLQQMRDNSKTGGALGNVSENENLLLQAINGALDPKNRSQLEANLDRIKALYPQVLKEKENTYLRVYGEAYTHTDKNKGRISGEPNNGGPLSPDEKKRLQELRRKARGQ